MKAKDNKKYLAELLAKRDEKDKKREDIAEAVNEMNKHNVVIDSVVAIQGALSYGCEIEAKPWFIQRIMKYDLHM